MAMIGWCLVKMCVFAYMQREYEVLVNNKCGSFDRVCMIPEFKLLFARFLCVRYVSCVLCFAKMHNCVKG